jgi:hypothetical protein
MVVYIVGSTIRKAMKTERFFELIHTKASIIIDAIGVALIIKIRGSIRLLKKINLYENIDKIIPRIEPRKKPVIILINVFAIDIYISLVFKRLTKDINTSIGEGSNSLLFIILLIRYQKIIQKRLA